MLCVASGVISTLSGGCGVATSFEPWVGAWIFGGALGTSDLSIGV
jgi:hypothetical protein